MIKGVYHNLNIIYSRLNEHYFQNQIDSAITWGKWGKGKNTRSIRLGSYDASRRLITIHPALDQAGVPRICVERIVYHEMLHQKHPIKIKNGRRSIHTASFLEEEIYFTGAQIADQWFKCNLDRLLRFRPSYLKNNLNVLTD